MTDSEIDSVYKWLVRKYVYDSPQNPLQKLSIDLLFLQRKGKSRERAVLELALASGFWHRGIEAMIREGKSKDDAIAAFLETQKLNLTEDHEETKRFVQKILGDRIYDSSVHPSSVMASEIGREPTMLWYLALIFLGLVGGLIGYVAVKDDSKNMAEKLLTLGILVFILDIFVAWLTLITLLH